MEISANMSNEEIDEIIRQKDNAKRVAEEGNRMELAVGCSKCKDCESQGADESRNHFGSFTYYASADTWQCNSCKGKAKAEYYINEDSDDYVEHFVTYHRNPTAGEIRFGHGAIHYKDFSEADIINPKNGEYKKWLKCPQDGLRYYY